LGECKDFWCGASWFGEFGQQVLIGGAEAVGQLLWMTCTLCMGIESGVNVVEALSDWDAHIAGEMEKAEATAAIWEGGLPAIWGSIADPIIHNWENNPGNAFGHLYVDVATLAIPGAGVGVGLKGLRTLKVTEQAAVETADAA
jgi:Na+-driven multidrug efflux pump